MPWLFDLRLIGLTSGTLVYLFLIVLIVGHRRPRSLERYLFFLALSLFLIYSGGLLEINARIQYGSLPEATQLLCESLISLGILFLPPLVALCLAAYMEQERGEAAHAWVTALSYLFFLVPLGRLAEGGLASYEHLGMAVRAFLDSQVRGAGFVAFGSAMVGLILQLLVAGSAKNPAERAVFRWLLSATGASAVALFLRQLIISPSWAAEGALTAAVLAGVLPGAVLIYFSLKHNFLNFGRQRNLVYALSATFLGLLYLALVRRVSGWMEPVLPPEATASILLFVLIFLFEPLERAIGPVLHRRMSERMGRVQRLTVELQQEARQGSVGQLVAFAEWRVREEFGIAEVRISIPWNGASLPLESPGGLGHAIRVPLKKDGEEMGLLEAASTGSYLTGETSAALEFIGEQLPAMIELCRLIEDKVRLERELAEHERLALLGQMAASVSHNLRNPLSSMKTILQVQLEHPNLPLDVRHDCALVVGEIDRMGEKLKQLLNFAKPSVNGQSVAAVALARQTAALFARDAERRNLRLEFDGPVEEIFILASEDALGEVLSNLIVNAIEAQPNGGRVRVGLMCDGGRLEIRVEDDGPGISPELRAKMFQPYFTTKATGTGLGLSIVARRVDEMGGTISCESPVRDGKGTRLRMMLPVAAGG